MNRERKLAHIVAYYLSRFDKEALAQLGYKTDREAFHKTAEFLGLVPNYIKFRRDEFDVAHPHRKGWHKRPMTLSVNNTINALKDLDEPILRHIVLDILSKGTNSEVSDNLDQLTLIFPHEERKRKKGTFIPRNITGRKAEEIFTEWYKKNSRVFPIAKDFIDMRDYGCGYDFQLITPDNIVYALEVKGLSDEDGGILITSKEWEVALKMKQNYYLVVITSINNQPTVSVINNPRKVLSPKRNVQTVIQVNWSVSKSEIQQLLKI